MKHIFQIVSIILLLSQPAWAADVIISWTPPSDARVVGYDIYYGPNNPPAETVMEVSGAETASVDVTGLPEDSYVYFGAKSRDADGNTSAMSDIVEWRYDPEPETIHYIERPGAVKVQTVTTTTTTTTVE